ncbi:GspE/PulE family protein [uncultured Pseudoteredinibacter sp.]|uniref:GspE/PulE family protein n=1 Tax=uncultured Pseudoteredinibacter sp. TaxID=1641701 RepID=UPI00260349F9|nr:GspE/PulE family protein [uncultured Pseudoteredinibacter sp.]
MNAVSDRILSLRSVLDDLRADGRLSAADANVLIGSSRSKDEAAMHPITYIANQRLDDQGQEGQILNADVLSQWMADKAGLPIFHLDSLKLRAAEVTKVMSFAFAKRHDILCVEVSSDHITVASNQPFNNAWVEQLEHVARKKVRQVFAFPGDVDKARAEIYTLSRSISGAKGLQGGTSVSNFEQLLELGKLKDPEANDQHIINIVDWLLQYAFDQRASDIHLEPRRETGKLRFRIDGILHTVYELPKGVSTAVLSRMKILGRMDIAEKRKPQDGRVKTKRPDGSEVELRLSTLPTAFGEKLVMRIFDPDVLLRSFEDLGLLGDDLDRWQEMVGRPNGIVLVTGPTGSGKTTTLYTSLKSLATSEVNVSTIEDPIEMVEDSFNQTQVQNNIGLDFAAGVRTLMRQDPDIIMVGEIRDQETAQMASQAALTGHLVLSTLHTNDAAGALSRLLDLGLPAYMIRSTLSGVVAQRLVRTLCPHCKQETAVDLDLWNSLVAPWKVTPPKHVYKPVGCNECRHTGYLGRQGIYEILLLSEHLRGLIDDQLDLQAMRKEAMREGMRTLRLSGAQKVSAGTTTIEEVIRVAPPPEK